MAQVSSSQVVRCWHTDLGICNGSYCSYNGSRVSTPDDADRVIRTADSVYEGFLVLTCGYHGIASTAFFDFVYDINGELFGKRTPSWYVQFPSDKDSPLIVSLLTYFANACDVFNVRDYRPLLNLQCNCKNVRDAIASSVAGRLGLVEEIEDINAAPETVLVGSCPGKHGISYICTGHATLGRDEKRYFVSIAFRNKVSRFLFQKMHLERYCGDQLANAIIQVPAFDRSMPIKRLPL